MTGLNAWIWCLLWEKCYGDKVTFTVCSCLLKQPHLLLEKVLQGGYQNHVQKVLSLCLKYFCLLNVQSGRKNLRGLIAFSLSPRFHLLLLQISGIWIFRDNCELATWCACQRKIENCPTQFSQRWAVKCFPSFRWTFLGTSSYTARGGTTRWLSSSLTWHLFRTVKVLPLHLLVLRSWSGRNTEPKHSLVFLVVTHILFAHTSLVLLLTYSDK